MFRLGKGEVHVETDQCQNLKFDLIYYMTIYFTKITILYQLHIVSFFHVKIDFTF